MTHLPAYVFVLDTLSYDARGGVAEVYASLEGAMAACPHVKEWRHSVDSKGEESWTQVTRSGADEAEEVRRVEVKP